MTRLMKRKPETMKRNVLIQPARALMLLFLAATIAPLSAQEISFMRNRVVSPEIHPDNSVSHQIGNPDFKIVVLS